MDSTESLANGSKIDPIAPETSQRGLSNRSERNGAPKRDLTGQRFGRLTVITWIPSHTRHAQWLCDCDCGERRIVSVDRLRQTRSCGCLRREPWAYKHGDKGSRLYAVWKAMKKRCYQVGSINYHNYGGRGIVLCDEWRDDYRPFKAWAMANGYEEGLSIDRLDNNDIYKPSNCRWVSRTEQNRNRRITKRVTVHGEEMAVAAAAEKYGLPYSRLKARLKAGLAPEDAVAPGIDPFGRRSLGTAAATAAKNAKKAASPRAEANV